MKTVLVLEPHPDIQSLIKIFIQNSFEVQVKMAPSEKEAIDLLNDMKVDLMILSGLSASEGTRFVIVRSFLKSFKPEIPFIIFAHTEAVKFSNENAAPYATIAKMEFKELVFAIKKLGTFRETSKSFRRN